MLTSTRLSKGTRFFVCNKCFKVFSQKKLLNLHKTKNCQQKLEHLNGRKKIKSFECYICKQTRASEITIRKHMIQIHLRERSLISHKLIHTADKPYACDLCSYETKYKSALNAHKRIHTGERPYSCDQCSLRFFAASRLSFHKRIHSSEKPYSCDQCSLSFARSSYLTRHKRKHSPHSVEKRFSCDQCLMKFELRTNLNQHKKRHIGDKPYTCSGCSLQFSTKRYIINHFKYNMPS